MGLLKLLALPASGPIRAVVWIAEHLVEQAEAQLYNQDAVRGNLMELELQYDAGEISEEQYLELEDALLAQLEAIRERNAKRDA